MNTFEQGREYARRMKSETGPLNSPEIEKGKHLNWIRGFLYERTRFHVGGNKPKFDASYYVDRIPDNLRDLIERYWKEKMEMTTKINKKSHPTGCHHRLTVAKMEDIQSMVVDLSKGSPTPQVIMDDLWKQYHGCQKKIDIGRSNRDKGLRVPVVPREVISSNLEEEFDIDMGQQNIVGFGLPPKIDTITVIIGGKEVTGTVEHIRMLL
jgi:hypothetical protein